MKSTELLKWRTKHTLTRKELATSLSTTVTTVYRWETALRKIPPFLPLALKWLELEIEGGEQERNVKGKSKKTTKKGGLK